MKKLPQHEETEEKRAYYDYLNRWNKNYKIHHVIILIAVILIFGLLACWFKESGLLWQLI